MTNLAGNELEVLQEIADRLTPDQRGMIGHCFKNKLSVALLSLSFYQGERGMYGKAADNIRLACNQMLDFVKILCGDATAQRGDRPTIETAVVVCDPPMPDTVEIDMTDI